MLREIYDCNVLCLEYSFQVIGILCYPMHDIDTYIV